MRTKGTRWFKFK